MLVATTALPKPAQACPALEIAAAVQRHVLQARARTPPIYIRHCKTCARRGAQCHEW